MAGSYGSMNVFYWCKSSSARMKADISHILRLTSQLCIKSSHVGLSSGRRGSIKKKQN